MDHVSRRQPASEVRSGFRLEDVGLNDVGRNHGVTPAACEAEPPGRRPPDASSDVRMSRLARTIEEEIIPRLMLAHRTVVDMPVGIPGPRRVLTDADVRQFAKLVLAHDEDVALSTIQTLRGQGVSVEEIYLDLLGPTARHLGELWEEDLCDFTEVTIGLGRLQRVLRELSPALDGSAVHAAPGRRVLLLPGPGEQHTFGLSMVAEFFRRAGWSVSGGAWPAEDDADEDASATAAEMVGAEWFDAIGYSLGSELHLPQLTAIIARMRRVACNRRLVVLVGGPLFGLHPEFVEQVGADGMTIDGREAPFLADTLIDRQSPRAAARA